MRPDDVTRRGRDIDYAKPLPKAAIRKGRHRTRVGGQWDELGELQLEFMIAQGLRPEHRLLDVGCGALRAGIRFVDYLQPAGYYGIDINQTLLDAGFERELPEHLRSKLPGHTCTRRIASTAISAWNSTSPSPSPCSRTSL